MKKLNEIVIYTTPEMLKKKQNKRYSYHFWSFTRAPKLFMDINRIYFAIEGRVQGSFKVTAHGIKGKKKRLYFPPWTWRKTKYKIMIKAFRGFRYRWW